MPLLISTDSESPLYEQRVTLDKQEYVLYFDYSQREDRWYLSVGLVDGSMLVRGWKLVLGVGFGPRIADRRIFAGVLVIETGAVDRSPPGWGELGENKRCQLYYMSHEEMSA